ncbi:hypothetical protein [Aestuariibaculum suncheonense]|uniref:Uncharacterized protein n=1 Tax=Aestuariibaculum suncheonense TaxID=1028745 RepID=A0A8J6QPY6_9FLAO|nr:hypothetical protein [Aestuariibaculum suncheonense]MBD0834459.1 hypothetical protein [Aestuariibaculum suncheonense]
MNFFKSFLKQNNESQPKYDSPVFIGPKEDFNKYFGPRLRNLVQYITRNYKTSIGKCQHCSEVKSKGLDAAHVHGKERSVLIDQALENFMKEGLVEVDLNAFEQAFIQLHDPIEEVILVLCKDCHVKYDGNGKIENIVTAPKLKTKPVYTFNSGSYSNQPRTGSKYNNKEVQIRISKAALNIPQEELDRLCDSAYSKNVFDNNYPILVRVPSSASHEIKNKVIRDHSDMARWTWKYQFERSGFVYAITTQWYNRNDEGVQKWLRKFEANNNILS